jgi:hypothetical protein
VNSFHPLSALSTNFQIQLSNIPPKIPAIPRATNLICQPSPPPLKVNPRDDARVSCYSGHAHHHRVNKRVSPTHPRSSHLLEILGRILRHRRKRVSDFVECSTRKKSVGGSVRLNNLSAGTSEEKKREINLEAKIND